MMFQDYRSGFTFKGNIKTLKGAEKKLIKQIKEELKNVSGSVFIPTGLTDEEVLKIYKDQCELVLSEAKNDAITRMVENYFKEEFGIEITIPFYHVWDLSAFE